MSDGIFERDSMFSADRLVPWHGKGKVVDEPWVLANRVNEIAGLNYLYGFRDIILPDGTTWPHNRFVVREDSGEVVSVVGSGYELVQPSEFPQMLDSLVGSHEAHFTTAGSLFNATQMWWALSLQNEIRVGGDPKETLDEFLMAVTSFDGSRRAGMYVTAIRPVCNNTVSWGIGSAQRSYSTKHTQNVRDRLIGAQEVLGLARHYGDVLKQVADLLVGVKFADSDIEQTLDTIEATSLKFVSGEKAGEPKTKNALTRASNKRDEFTTVLQKRPDLNRIKDTAYGFLQAGVEINDHFGQFNNTKTSDQWDNRFSNVFGLNAVPNFSQEVFGALDNRLGFVKALGLDKKQKSLV